jgi:phosphatidylglycerol lysyltransferase
VNLFSVLTPAGTERLKLLKDFIPGNVVYFSNFSVIIFGVVLIILSAFLLKGLKNSWLAAVIISFLSIIGHLSKAIDYEEATFALFVLLLLIYTRKNYFVRSDFRLFRTARWYFARFIMFIFAYGVIGFYMLSKKHFGFDLNLEHSFLYLLNSLLIFNNSALSAYTPFAMWFVHSLNFLGIVLIASFLYFLLKPYRHLFKNEPTDIELAKTVVQKSGCSALDYFKTYSDKLIYFSQDKKSFISFKTTNDYAIVLEMPVCENEEQIPEIINEFDDYCLSNGIKTLYYRVDESHLKYFCNKNYLYIGQEGIVDLSVFTLEGGDKKPERNALNKVKNLGYKCRMYEPPQKDGFLQKLKSVSDEWLITLNKKEATFSQGIWNTTEIKNQVVFAVENGEERIVAFTNIIPDYESSEGTYDLIRKTVDAPNGVLDVLMVNMIDYFKTQNKKYLNLGMTPFAGIDQANNFKERTIKIAYERFRQFDHFKGLRFFKEKYATTWKNKYLIYESDFDLLQAPVLIEKVSKP